MDFPRLDVHRPWLIPRLRAIRARLREVRPRLLVTYNWGAIEWAQANGIRPPFVACALGHRGCVIENLEQIPILLGRHDGNSQIINQSQLLEYLKETAVDVADL